MKTLLIVILTLMLFVGTVYGEISWGLEITNGVNGLPITPPGGIPVPSPNSVRAESIFFQMCDTCPGVVEGYDNMEWDNFFYDYPMWWLETIPEYTFFGLFSDLPADDEWDSMPLWHDYRPWGCTEFDIKLFNKNEVPEVNGISEICQNSLFVRYTTTQLPDPCSPFEGACVYLYSDRLIFGFVVNVKTLIATTPVETYGHRIALLPLKHDEFPKTYYCYGSGEDEHGIYGYCEYHTGVYGFANIIVCEEGCLSSMLSKICSADFAGFSTLANDWGKPQGKYLADISGENGLPDGYVDFYDLAEFVSVWLNQ